MANTTIDRKEIEKFEQLSNNWLDPNGAFKILYEINPLRIKYIISKIYKHFNIDHFNNINLKSTPNLSIVDIGCGGGLVSTNLAQFSLDITGLDAVFNNIEKAKSYANSLNRNVNFIHGEINDLISKNLQYDVIICLEVLEHLSNLEFFFEGMSKILKPGGMIIISTINRTAKAFLLAIIAGEYILKWVPVKTHDYNKFLKPSEIQKFLNKSSLRIEELKGLNYNLIENKWHISNNIDVNYFAYIK